MAAGRAGAAALTDLGAKVPNQIRRDFSRDIKKAETAEQQTAALAALKRSLQGTGAEGFSKQQLKDFRKAIKDATDEVGRNERGIEQSTEKRNKILKILDREIKVRDRVITSQEQMANALEKLPQRLADLDFQARTAPTLGGRNQARFQRDKIGDVMNTLDLSRGASLTGEEFRDRITQLRGSTDPADQDKLATALRDIAKAEQFIGATVGELQSFEPNRDLEVINHELRTSIVDLKNQIEQATSNAERARLTFDLNSLQEQLGAGTATGQTATGARGAINRIRRKNVDRGLGQTFAESSILNPTDEERAQRMNELLRDGSVQFANNIGTAMHKAIRDGESFSDGLRGAGLAFLDYISEAMMQMAAQQVVGQFTSGMFGQGGASQTGGATAGGGFWFSSCWYVLRRWRWRWQCHWRRTSWG